jgi:acetoin utilization protein AcuB
MFVRTYMTPDPVTISPDDNFPKTMNVIHKHKIRHLPVIEQNRLIGIIAEKDLLSNQPSPVVALNLHEVHSLLEAIRVRQIMSKPVITVEGDCPLEEAARIMVENKISCLPVMDGESLVGLITETEIFKVLMEVLGGREEGTRLTLNIPERVGELAAISSYVAASGGNIVAVTTSEILDGGKRQVTIKTAGVDQEILAQLLEGTQVEILDIQPCNDPYEVRLFG